MSEKLCKSKKNVTPLYNSDVSVCNAAYLLAWIRVTNSTNYPARRLQRDIIKIIGVSYVTTVTTHSYNSPTTQVVSAAKTARTTTMATRRHCSAIARACTPRAADPTISLVPPPARPTRERCRLRLAALISSAGADS